MKSLYRLLYQETFPSIRSRGDLAGEAEDIFQEAFFILTRKMPPEEANRLAGDNPHGKERLLNLFRRFLDDRIYTIERSVFRVVEGARLQVIPARRQLGKVLYTAATLGYVRKLLEQYKLEVVTAEDILQECIAVLFERIDSGTFTLDPEAANALNKNRLFKFFFETIRRKTSAWKKQTPGAEPIAHDWADDPVEVENQIFRPGLFHQAMEALNALDPAGQFILKETYGNHRSPKQIAGIIPFEDYKSTEAVVRKKWESLNKLRDYFSSVLKDLDAKAVGQLQKISELVLEKMLEPCKTILQNAFPPLEKTLEEIAALLRQTRPAEEVAGLASAEQVKKRKYKCLQSLQEALWKELLEPQKP